MIKEKEIEWGEPFTGTILLECEECHKKWSTSVINEPIGEYLGFKCPTCKKITKNLFISRNVNETLDKWL